MAEKKTIELWSIFIELYEGRTPIPELEKALSKLPDSFLTFNNSSAKPNLQVCGDSAYGVYMIPINPQYLQGVSFPKEVENKNPWKNPEGTFISFIYKDRAYTLRITDTVLEQAL